MLDPTGTGHPYQPPRNFYHRIWTNPVTRSGWGWGHVPVPSVATPLTTRPVTWYVLFSVLLLVCAYIFLNKYSD